MKKQKTIHRLPNTNIVIDYWRSLRNEDKFIRFMTIFRLEDNQLKCMKRSNYTIYTSSNNKKLLEFHEIPSDRVVAIEQGRCIEINDENAEYSFNVSTIESNYCVGSCMFLFQGPFGNILFTSFFRPAQSCDPLKDPILKPLIRDKRVDEVYIDNTYAAEHCRFPSRADVIEEALHLIKEHPDHKIVIVGNRFGKEEILRDIAMALDESIGVSKSKYEELSCMMTLQSLSKFTFHADECRIIVEDELLSLNECKKKQVKYGLCIIILLTAQYICEERRIGTLMPRLSNLHILPYSSHASHDELMEFLYNLKARKIMPIILSKSSNTSIPKKMMEMCYTNRDSVSFEDSDFYFETFTSALASENEYITPSETLTQHQDCRNLPSNNIDDRLMNRTFIVEDEPMDCDRSSNVNNNDRKNSVDSDVYHESESVAFVSLLEVQDENGSHENSYEMEKMVDPLSLTNTSVVSDSSELESDVRAETVSVSTVERFQDNGTITSVPQSGNTNTPSLLDTSLSNPELCSLGDRVDNVETGNKAFNVPNFVNSQPYEKVCPDEIITGDVIVPDGYSEAMCNENDQSEMSEENYGSNISLAMSDHFNDEGMEIRDYSSPLIGESADDEDARLSAVLYHVRLVTEPEDWKGTKLRKNSWAALTGVNFF